MIQVKKRITLANFQHYFVRYANKKNLMVAFSLIGIGFLVYSFLTRHHISTDDAYVNANVVPVAPQVKGRVMKVYVDNNDRVHEGDPLFDIDPTPFQVAVDKARAQLSLALQNEAQLEAAVQAATAQVAIREAELQNAEATAARKLALVRAKQLPAQEGDDAASAVKTAVAALDLAKANLQESKMALGTAGAENEQIHVAKSNLAEAELNLNYTHVVAATNGYIANMALRSGMIVDASTPIFALIGEDAFWIDANFKETEIQAIQPGQKAEIEVDMYPGKIFEGVVDSISGGSGTAFSLLPPQNATGNWVKVTQRVPVKIEITNVNKQYPLRIGTSAAVTVFAKKVE